MRFAKQRRSPLSALAVLALLVLGANYVGYCAANPYTYTGEIPPDQETYPPVITITSPINNTAYNTSLVSLTFNVSAPQSRTASSTTVQGVSYKADWYKEAVDVLHGGQEQPSFNLQFSNVPEGQHSIVIKAVGYGLYKSETEWWSYKWFFIRSTATISFTIDHTAPTVSVLPPENVSSSSPIPLNFTVNEAYSRIAFSLNGQQNVTVTGNSTLPHLVAGPYNLTLYVWDVAGNVGSSKTVTFTVVNPELAEPSPVVPVAAVSVAVLALVVAGLLIYHRQRKQKLLNRGNFD